MRLAEHYRVLEFGFIGLALFHLLWSIVSGDSKSAVIVGCCACILVCQAIRRVESLRAELRDRDRDH